MTQYAFGIGTLRALRTDIANATPAEFGTIKDVSLDLAFSIKELTGQFQAPAALARAGLKITGKAQSARISAAMWNNVFFGQTLGTGNTLTQLGEAANVPGSSVYTVQPANHATFVADLGVVYAATGVPFSVVASSPALGQYSVNAATGTYTFAAADASAAIKITYTYTISGGTSITLTNQLMGSGPTFQLILMEQFVFGGVTKNLNLQLNSVLSSKFALAFKNEDFTIPEFDFQASADAAGNIGNIWLSE